METIPAPGRKDRSDIESFSKAELTPKPLVAFEEPAAPTALPLTW
jgi:hypothetical protein